MATTQPTNPAVFSPALLRQPIADQRTLLVTQPWARWMQASWGRQGGAQAPSNAELDSGLGDTNDSLGQTQTTLAQTNAALAALTTRVTTLETQLAALTTRVTTLETSLTALTTRVTTLETTVTSQGTRLAALEAWKTAVVAGLPAVVTVTAVPTLAVAPATPTVLRDDLTTNWQPRVDTNDADLASAANALRNALAA